MPAAAILSGGQSRRMGRTKALVDVDGVPMAARVATSLAAAGLSDVALIGGDPIELDVLGLPVVADLYPGDGPVGGLLTAFDHFAGADLLLVACDLPFLDAPTIGSIVQSFEISDADVAVAHTGQVEPLCAVWSASTAPRVGRLFADGTRAMHRVLHQLNTVAVTVGSGALRNINRPDDLPAG